MPRGGYREGAGSKPKWKHGKTKVIRVPEVLADRVLEYARQLDQGKLEQQEIKKIVPVESLKIIDLGGVSLKAIDGQMGVMLSSLIKKGYKITPDHLHQIVINALKNQKLWR